MRKKHQEGVETPAIARRRRAWKRVTGCVLLGVACLQLAHGQETLPNAALDQRIDRLEQTLQNVLQELESLKVQRQSLENKAAQEQERARALEQRQEALLEEVASLRETATPELDADGPILPEGLVLGAYGEHHFNFTQGGSDVSDIHRFVGFLGYEFTDWLHFNSETEIEHAFVNGGDGEIVLEQFYVDMNFNPRLNFRMGRVLHPAGIINMYHEPTTFYSVERPTYSSMILPSTWSIDGAGFWGNLTDWLSYQVYVHGGLDGSGFNGTDGIRGGRLKERPSLNDPGVSSRLDFHPFTAFNIESPLAWRTGFSYSFIGTENGDQGADAGKPDGAVQIFAFDTQLGWQRWEARAEAAWVSNSAADEPGVGPADLTRPGTSDEMFGAYGELAYHWWPEAWAQGRYADSDAVVFVRYEYLDPQFGDVTFGTKTDATLRKETTFGLAYFPVPNLVFKADYTFADRGAGRADDRFGLGFGYDF